MRRSGNLFESIVERENLREAFRRASNGKRSQREVLAFAADLEKRLAQLAHGLQTETYRLGRYHQFVIRDPKERVITAPCFEERVLHHAIMNICEPIFDRWLIDDTFACRIGKGREAAVYRAASFSRRYPHFLKLDVRKYFDSISHEKLRSLLRRRFKDPRLLALFDQIINAFRGSIGHGLPIGSLTSQHFANFYLGWFDRFVKERLRVAGYVRYMDDMVLWGRTLNEMRSFQDECLRFTASELQLELKTPFLNHCSHGLDWLGCRVFPTHTILNRRSRIRFRRRLTELEQAADAGEITARELQSRCESLVAFTSSAGARSWKFRQAVIQKRGVGDR